jgi:CubicO group peptidase (beta-lactamase class C family)
VHVHSSDGFAVSRPRTFSLALAALIASRAAAAVAAGESAPLATAVDAAVEEWMAQDRTPGVSVGIEHGGRVLVARGYGVADLENDAPATERTVYRIGSITKQFTAAAILLLEERGKLHLEDDLRTVLTEYPSDGPAITIERLLNHTSGIKGYTEMPEFWSRSREDLTPAQMLELFSKLPLEFAPGKRWQYSNSGYYLLGLIVERVSGRTYAEFLRAEIFEPLGLAETTYLDDRPIVENRAEGYELDDGQIVNDAYLSMRTPFSAGALGSSVGDLLRWQAALAGGRLLRPESFGRMSTPGTLRGGETLDYGFGLAVAALDGHRKIEHGGGINGFRTQLSWYPDDALTITVLANCGCAHPERLESRLARIVLGLSERQVTEIELSAEAMATYAGVYDPGRSPMPVVLRDGALWLQGERLRPVGEHRFVLGGDPYQEVSFGVERGRAVDLRLEREGRVVVAPRVELGAGKR